MTQFLILIYGDEQRWATMSDAETNEIHTAHAALRERAGTAVLASGQLQRPKTAVSVRAGENGPQVTDGPFVESKEILGGFYLIDAADQDAAVALVSDLAEVRHDHSGVVVQPLV